MVESSNSKSRCQEWFSAHLFICMSVFQQGRAGTAEGRGNSILPLRGKFLLVGDADPSLRSSSLEKQRSWACDAGFLLLSWTHGLYSASYRTQQGAWQKAKAPEASWTLAALLIGNLCLVGLVPWMGWRRKQGGGRHHSLPGLAPCPGCGRKSALLLPPPSDALVCIWDVFPATVPPGVSLMCKKGEKCRRMWV